MNGGPRPGGPCFLRPVCARLWGQQFTGIWKFIKLMGGWGGRRTCVPPNVAQEGAQRPPDVGPQSSGRPLARSPRTGPNRCKKRANGHRLCVPVSPAASTCARRPYTQAGHIGPCPYGRLPGVSPPPPLYHRGGGERPLAKEKPFSTTAARGRLVGHPGQTHLLTRGSQLLSPALRIREAPKATSFGEITPPRAKTAVFLLAVFFPPRRESGPGFFLITGPRVLARLSPPNR